MNVQRQTIYGQRLQVLNGEDLKPSIVKMTNGIIDDAVAGIFGDAKHTTPEAILGIGREWGYLFPAGTLEDASLAELAQDELCRKLHEAAAVRYAEKEAEIGEPLMREAERVFLLQTVDRLWMEQLDAMQELRQGIGLRAYAQHDPVIEYKREGFEMFEAMIREIRETTVRILYNLRLRSKEEPKRQQVAKITTDTRGDGSERPHPARHKEKPGRNDPCPCGSGKKYKKCCGRNE